MIKVSELKQGYGLLVDAIIRPPRALYEITDLGPKEFRIGSKQFWREDLELVNKRGLKLQVSHYQPKVMPRPQLPCVIYLHGNCGSRMDALDCLNMLLPANITVVSFDFAGSGLSEGEYVSLGFFEQEDLETVISYLRSTEKVSRIGLWGRSMGAATALLFGGSDPSIACMVLDSPFISLNQIAQELATNSPIKVPKMMVGIGLKMVAKSVKKKAKIDISKLTPIKGAESCFMPALFIHGKDDTFVGPWHSKQIAEIYAGDHNLLLVDGDHNSRRPSYVYDSISIFFHNMLLSEEEKKANESSELTPPETDFFAGRTPNFVRGGSPFDPFRSLATAGTSNELFDDEDDELLRQAIMLSLQDSNKSGTENT